MKQFWKSVSFPLLLAMVIGLLAGCASAKEKNFQTKEDFARARIGIITGSSHDLTARKNFPEAKRVYFNSMADMVLALEQGKIDCYVEDAPFLPALLWEGIRLKAFEDPLLQGKNGFVFPKGEASLALREEINAFFAEAKADGTIERLKEKWIGEKEPEEHPDYEALTGEKGTLHIAISVDNKPLLYQREGRYTGFEMELLTLFGEKCGYAFDFEVVTFESIIAGIVSGKYDMGVSALNITPERAESVDFSEPYANFDVVLIVKDETQPGMRLADIGDGKIAVLTGSIWDGVAMEVFPEAERKHFSLIPDMILALEQGKVDALLGDRTFYVNARWENAPVTVLEETVGSISCGFMLAKDSYDAKLLDRLNEFIAGSRSDGRLDALAEKWLSGTEPTQHPDYRSLSGENGVLRIAVENAAKPMTYRKGDVFTGYDVDFLTQFAREYGYGLEFTGMSFDALIPSVASGKSDIGACGIAITAERAESVTFTDCYEEIDGVVMVRQDTAARSRGDFWKNAREGFEKTFIRENRWKLIAEGVWVTMLISLCSAVFGSLLGFGLYMLGRSDIAYVQKLAGAVARVYSRIVSGTPVVVILMILFYVVFGKFRDMNGILVAIIGFTITFGAFVYDHMTVSVTSVGRDQVEAAYALGYTKNKTFFRIVFPQAMSIFLPSYCGQAVELIKATAVVGYIAVNDLTKMGDIIRSNTYEAFFPLIATAVIYFVLTWILAFLLEFLKRHFEPKRRSKEDILKGIKTA